MISEFTVCAWVCSLFFPPIFLGVILDTGNCFRHLTASGSASTAFLVLWQTNGWCHSKPGFKEQGQVHSESDCIQAWISCKITRFYYKFLILLPACGSFSVLEESKATSLSVKQEISSWEKVVFVLLIGFVWWMKEKLVTFEVCWVLWNDKDTARIPSCDNVQLLLYSAMRAQELKT